MSASDSLSRLNARLLLESSRTFLKAKDPLFIARNIALEIMGKFMISKVAIAIKKEAEYELLFIRGASDYAEGNLLSREMIEGFQDHNHHFFKEESLKIHCVRLGSETEEIGIVIMGMKTDAETLSEEASEWIEQLCNFGAIALQNGLLIHQLRDVNRELDRKVVELKTLFEVAKEFNSLLTQDQINSLFKYTLMGQLLTNKAFLAVRKDSTFKVLTSNGLVAEPSTNSLSQIVDVLATNLTIDHTSQRYSKSLVISQRESSPVKELGLELCLAIRQENPESKGTDHIIALVGLGPKLTKKEYSAAELQMVESIANLSLLSIEKTYLMDEMIEKRRMMEELAIARTIQQGLIPNPIPELDALDTALMSIPSREVGGDYVDVARTPDGNLIFAIADVSGKGIPAALLMANLQAMLHVLLPVEISLSEAVGRINTLLVQNTPSDRFITFFLGKFYRDEKCFRYINAGHNPGFLLRNGKQEIEELSTGGLLLGALPTLMPYETGEVFLEKGDRLLLYTDGVTETFNPSRTEEFGEERLQEILLRYREDDSKTFLDKLLREVESFGDPRASDDLTALTIRLIQ